MKFGNENVFLILPLTTFINSSDDGIDVVDDESVVEQFGFEEEVAENILAGNFGAYSKTGFPKPLRRLRMVFESEKASIEETYFYVLNTCRQDMGFGDVVKTVDTFSASENSSFWGMTEQRKGIQQDRASQYLATIGKMVKELFQIVREIRVLKERIQLYDGAKKGRQADDIALKSYWADMVDGGTKGQMNVYQMAQQVGFGTLPDLMFSIFVKPGDDVAKIVDEKAGEFNEKVRSVLKQKLAKFLAWKEQTDKEIRNREQFTTKYLRQHWSSIRMYISWIKPYLKNVQKLSAPDKYDDNPDLISSFEGAIMEIEFVARQASKGSKATPTILATFEYRVKPQMQFQADSYQNRGPLHVGRIEFSLRSYGWTDEDLKEYIKMREQETMELLGLVDSSIKDAMDALGDELLDYLEEAGEEVAPYRLQKPEETQKEKPPSANMLEPFTALFGGFKDMFMLPFGPMMSVFKRPEKSGNYRGDKKAAKTASSFSYNVYKIYKKAHGPMPTW